MTPFRTVARLWVERIQAVLPAFRTSSIEARRIIFLLREAGAISPYTAQSFRRFTTTAAHRASVTSGALPRPDCTVLAQVVGFSRCFGPRWTRVLVYFVLACSHPTATR